MVIAPFPAIFFFFLVGVALSVGGSHDVIDDLHALSPPPDTEPSLNSRAAIVRGTSPIDLSGILS